MSDPKELRHKYAPVTSPRKRQVFAFARTYHRNISDLSKALSFKFGVSLEDSTVETKPSEKFTETGYKPSEYLRMTTSNFDFRIPDEAPFKFKTLEKLHSESIIYSDNVSYKFT